MSGEEERDDEIQADPTAKEEVVAALTEIDPVLGELAAQTDDPDELDKLLQEGLSEAGKLSANETPTTEKVEEDTQEQESTGNFLNTDFVRYRAEKESFIDRLAEESGWDEDITRQYKQSALSEVGMLEQAQGTIMALVTEIRESVIAPQKMQSAIASVPGAADTDVPAAKELMKAKPGLDFESALELTVGRRGTNGGMTQVERLRKARLANIQGKSGSANGSTEKKFIPGIEGFRADVRAQLGLK